MAIKSLARSTVRQAQRGNSALAGYESNYFHHLETVRLGGNASSVEFTNLARYNDFQHLQIRIVGATDRAGDWLDFLYLRFNNDSSANYATHRLFAEGTTIASGAFTSQTSIIRAFYVKGANGTASSFGAGVMDILDPFETTKNTTTRVLTGYVDASPTSETIVAFMSGLWMSTAAVTSITLASVNSANFIAGSRFSLYGLKARA